MAILPEIATPDRKVKYTNLPTSAFCEVKEKKKRRNQIRENISRKRQKREWQKKGGRECKHMKNVTNIFDIRFPLIKR